MDIDPELLKKAEDGDADAQHHIGMLYSLDLFGSKEDSDKAKYWLEQAAKNGHPTARLETQIQSGKVSRSEALSKRTSKSLEGHDRIRSGYSVLVIDDDETLFEVISRSSKGLPVAFSHAFGGADGLRKIQEQGFFDIVFLDYKLPNGNGLQVLNSIRQMEHGYSQRVVMMSGFTQPEYIKAAMQQKIISWLVKPLDFSKIRELIQQEVIVDSKSKSS